MKSSYRTLMMLAAAMLLSLPSSAQNLWVFSKKHTAAFEKTWPKDHYIPATQSGKGRITAKDAQGNDLASYELDGDRAVARPFMTGSYFLFEVPSDKLPAGSFVDFNATITIEDGAPMDWVLEVEDGGKWREGKTFRCYGPARGSAYRHTSLYQTFRLEEGVEDMIRFRVRALEGYVRPSKGAEKEGGAMFVSGSYLGALVNDFGTEAPKDTLKVLCIGNSFTYFSNVPSMLKEIAWHEGHELECGYYTDGGYTMKQHLADHVSRQAVEKGGYDYAFLQDQSLHSLRIGTDVDKNVVGYMGKMVAKVKEHSPKAKCFIELAQSTGEKI